jgi:hypothetical protein
MSTKLMDKLFDGMISDVELVEMVEQRDRIIADLENRLDKEHDNVLFIGETIETLHYLINVTTNGTV